MLPEYRRSQNGRFGHIELGTPVVHPLFHLTTNFIADLTGKSSTELRKIGERIGIQSALAICGEASTVGDARWYTFGKKYFSQGDDEGRVIANFAGVVQYEESACVLNREGQSVLVEPVCKLTICDHRGGELEQFELPCASLLHVNNADPVIRGKLLAEFMPNCDRLVAQQPGVMKLKDFKVRQSADEMSNSQIMIEALNPPQLPILAVIDEQGPVLQANYLNDGTLVRIAPGSQVFAGDVLAEWKHPFTPVNC